ncbi:MAG: hypothetical protein NW206_13015 [Hyphomonadaceae bacterium]|nr:hypothetical protein [Hyphomonadaceae bacterium]
MSDRQNLNADFAWAKFDPDAYVEHYYADPHPDDDEVVRQTCRTLAGVERADLETLDVGTGPNLFPLFAALPLARRLTVWEYGEANIAWMRRTLGAGQLAEPWRHFWAVAREAHGEAGAAVTAPVAELAARTDVVQGSIFDLPERRWDAATMFFCAESITAQQAEFERACAAYARAVRPGGVLAAAFLAGSRGYRVGDIDFPAVSITPDTLREAFAPHARQLEIAAIGAMGEEIRSGYSGMLFLSARAA